jgi:hypothetical protein
MRKILILSLLLFSLAVSAQETSEVITAANITRLQSLARIDFANLEYADSSLNPIAFQTGWFVYHELSQSFVVQDAHTHLWAVSFDGIITDELEGTDLVDAAAFGENDYAFLFSGDGQYRVLYDNFEANADSAQNMLIHSEDEPQAIWMSCPTPETCFASVEVRNGDETAVVSLPPVSDASTGIILELDESALTRIPYTPADDPEAVVRIGRIPPPFTVTSSLEGMVKLWNLQVGQTVYEVDNGRGQPSVFGAINNPPTHLVWRDNANQSLYLLNFETGENQRIAELNGDYAQWFFLSPDATVILAVNLGFEPNVVAWNVATGQQLILGEYRECSRAQPDMARLSADGTTLVIGCDTGLDIWRIAD